MKVKIVSKLETSDHDGYCSDDECEYEVKVVETIVDLPTQYKSHSKGKLNNLNEFDWEKLLPVPIVLGGSGYCCVDKECEAHGLGQHDYRYTILSVEIFDENDVNPNMKVKILSKLETSDHDGYCSGNDCDFEVKVVETIVDLPTLYILYPKGKLNNLNDFDWVKLLPEPNLNYEGSGYCCVSEECRIIGLGKHDYRYTILSVEIIDGDDINPIEKLDMNKIYED